MAEILPARLQVLLITLGAITPFGYSVSRAAVERRLTDLMAATRAEVAYTIKMAITVSMLEVLQRGFIKRIGPIPMLFAASSSPVPPPAPPSPAPTPPPPDLMPPRRDPEPELPLSDPAQDLPHPTPPALFPPHQRRGFTSYEDLQRAVDRISALARRKVVFHRPYAIKRLMHLCSVDRRTAAKALSLALAVKMIENIGGKTRSEEYVRRSEPVDVKAYLEEGLILRRKHVRSPHRWYTPEREPRPSA